MNQLIDTMNRLSRPDLCSGCERRTPSESLVGSVVLGNSYVRPECKSEQVEPLEPQYAQQMTAVAGVDFRSSAALLARLTPTEVLECGIDFVRDLETAAT